jgi:hypothetical protein
MREYWSLKAPYLDYGIDWIVEEGKGMQLKCHWGHRIATLDRGQERPEFYMLKETVGY